MQAGTASHRSTRSPLGKHRALRSGSFDEARAFLRVKTLGLLPARPRSVSEGFSHMGRFAAEYRRRFGELPSVTARRRKPS